MSGNGDTIRESLSIRVTNNARLHLRKPPLIFAIDNGDGTTENMWGIDIVRGSPIAYCGCL